MTKQRKHDDYNYTPKKRAKECHPCHGEGYSEEGKRCNLCRGKGYTEEEVFE